MSEQRRRSAHGKEAKGKPVEPEDGTESRDATANEIRMAIEALTPEESARLRLAAIYCLPGSEYDHFQDLINEAVVRAMSAAGGGSGRHWKIGVEFIAFMIMTVRGLSDDSRESLVQRKTNRLELMTAEGCSSEDVLGALGRSNPSVLELAVENQERIERQERAKADVDAIDTHFAGDDNIGWIVMGHKDDRSAAEIQQISGMSQTQYNSARRKFRRGLSRLFPSRSTK